jgi:hypothetical protein
VKFVPCIVASRIAIANLFIFLCYFVKFIGDLCVAD